VFKTFKEAWKVAELRKKILFTLLILVLFRIGCVVPMPFFDASQVEQMAKFQELMGGAKSAFGYLSMISGGALAQGTLFALSISPYITSQIIIQLLTIAIPALERLSKEGEEGRKKIQALTRYGTVILAVITSIGYYALLNSYGVLNFGSVPKSFGAIVMVATYTAGASLVMWLAEKINEHGIGNGISLMLFAGIVNGIPFMLDNMSRAGAYDLWLKIVIWVATIAVLILAIAFIVFVTESERRIPVQYAKKVVGRKMYGGQNSTLPIKLNMSGVMPFIFAQSIVSIPSTIKMVLQTKIDNSKFWTGFFKCFEPGSAAYLVTIVLLFVLIIAFAYFYLAISFNPDEVANNLKKNGGTVFGIRPGKPTADYIRRVVNRITLIGALFLSIIAIGPMLLTFIPVAPLAYVSLGGTSLLIAVGVALETEKELEAQMAMRNFKGFLE